MKQQAPSNIKVLSHIEILSHLNIRDRHTHRIILLLSVALVLSIIIALRFGSTPLSNQEFLQLFIGHTDLPSYLPTILFDIRLPRVLMAATIGSILAICGALLQGLFRNPLADPSLIGVSAGASLGASTVLFFTSFFSFSVSSSINTFVMISSGFLNLGELFFVSFGAFFGGAIAALFVYRLAKTRTSAGVSVTSMLLAGIAISAFSGALIGLINFYSDNETLRRISLWQMGSLDAANYTKVAILTAMAIVFMATIPHFYMRLNAFLLGESEARHLGIDTEKTKRNIIIISALGVGICVAFSGMIGFVGLVVPHLVRILLGPNHKTLLPCSMICGAILLVLADLLSRVVLAPTQLPIGIITAIIGAPIFISILSKRHSYGGGL